jgi:PAS domain S-box-containing protein
MSKSKRVAQDTAALDYWELFRELPELYVLITADDPRFTIVETNKARERLMGLSREDSIGMPLFELYPAHKDSEQLAIEHQMIENFRKVVHTQKPLELAPFRYDLTDAHGVMQQRYWRSTYVPLMLGGAKKVTHILASTRDVTDEERAIKRVANAEDRLQAALAIGKVGSWLWELDRDSIIGDKKSGEAV